MLTLAAGRLSSRVSLGMLRSLRLDRCQEEARVRGWAYMRRMGAGCIHACVEWVRIAYMHRMLPAGTQPAWCLL